MSVSKTILSAELWATGVPESGLLWEDVVPLALLHERSLAMNPRDFGLLIGTLIVQTSDQESHTIHKHIARDRTAIRANLPLAMAWVSQLKLEQLLNADDASDAVRAMLVPVMKHVMKITDWTYPVMKAVVENRLDGYDSAWAADGQPVSNITKYFVACCEELRQTVCYDQIIPDPDGFAEFGELVNQEALEDLRRVRREQHCATYIMDLQKTMPVELCIFSIGTGVEAAAAKYL